MAKFIIGGPEWMPYPKFYSLEMFKPNDALEVEVSVNLLTGVFIKLSRMPQAGVIQTFSPIKIFPQGEL